MELLTDFTMTPPRPGLPAAWPPPVPAARSQSTGSAWTAWTLATVSSIAAAVVVISVFSPDMVHGSEQQRLPVAALGTWLFGLGASIAAFVAMARLRGSRRRRTLWLIVFGATVASWFAATLVSVFGPTIVTGSDPTTIPMAALIAPIVAMLLTAVAATAVLVADGLSPMAEFDDR